MTYIKTIEKNGFKFRASNQFEGNIFLDCEDEKTMDALEKSDPDLLDAYRYLIMGRKKILQEMDQEEYKYEWDRILGEIEIIERDNPGEKDCGVIYLLKTEKQEYKIGLTRRSIDQRMKEIRPRMPSKTELVGTIKSDHVAMDEKFLHSCFKVKKIRGEWFKLTKEDVKFILEGKWS